MIRRFRIAMGSAVLMAGLALAGAAPANAQVRFEGSFPFPQGRISIGIGNPAFPVGAVVPYGYSVYSDPTYGYGFTYGDSWIPCERYGNGWIVVEQPVYFGNGYLRPYHRYAYDSRAYGYYSRPYHRRYGYYSRPYRRFGDWGERFEHREHERFEHRDFDRGWRR